MTKRATARCTWGMFDAIAAENERFRQALIEIGGDNPKHPNECDEVCYWPKCNDCDGLFPDRLCDSPGAIAWRALFPQVS